MMKTILVLGAGRSSSSLINYLLAHASTCDWNIIVGDFSEQTAQQKVGSSDRASAIHFDINNDELSRKIIEKAHVVISLMPANLHPLVAKLCLTLKKHFLNASYVSDEMKDFDGEARSNNLLFLNECGLDPGIDHMSAMQVLDKIKTEGGRLTSFESFTGGLISPETDPENPWRYKFTWNPRNVVTAGQGVAKFLVEGKYKYIPYQQLFRRTIPVTVLDTLYEGYPNRDSLKYLSTYGITDVKTMIRGTLRNAGYCSAWNVFVQLGCCDDTYVLEGVDQMSHRDFLDSFLEFNSSLSIEEKLCSALGLRMDGTEMQRLRWSGLFSSEKIGMAKGTPAQILEHILNKKWKLAPGDKDFIAMWHRFGYDLNGKFRQIQSHLTISGVDEVETAMAKTVGLPLGIAARLLVEGRIKKRGVVIPIEKEIYDPVLRELNRLGISLVETII